MTSTNSLTERIDILVREVNNSIANTGRQLSRRYIIELALRHGYQMGKDDECAEWTANLKGMMVGKVGE